MHRQGPAISAATAGRPPLLAWADYLGRLHLGDLTGTAQQVVAKVSADPAVPLVQAAGRIYWVDGNGARTHGVFHQNVVQDFDLATGKTSTVAPGESVFLSPDGRDLYLVQTQAELLELSAARPSSAARNLALPAGWRLICQVAARRPPACDREPDEELPGNRLDADSGTVSLHARR